MKRDIHITNIHIMSNTSLEHNLSTCANCGKGEETSINLKSCAACKSVKYCSRDCQVAHRPQHKKECKKRAKELYVEKLFEQPPMDDDDEDCPICMIRLPSLESGSVYMNCCGKVICRGCVFAFQSRAILAERVEEDNICPFCRTPPPSTGKEMIRRMEKRMEVNDAEAFHSMGIYFITGAHGLQQNYVKALEFYHKAAELGDAKSYAEIGNAYEIGRGVERDRKKAKHYYELAAMEGDACSRHNLGAIEGIAGNTDRALRHYMIAVKYGVSNSLEGIKRMYKCGQVTRDDYAKTLKFYQVYLDEIKSDQRDLAAKCFPDSHKYY